MKTLAHAATKMALAWLMALVVFWPALPALAVWDNDMDQPYADDVAGIANYCGWPRIIAGGLGVVGSFSARDRLMTCLQACTNVSPDNFTTQDKGKVFENSCCNLTGPPTAAYFTPVTLPISLILSQAMAGLDQVDSLKKKCTEVVKHTGSSACTFHSDSPGGAKDCCLEKSERTTSANEKCNVEKYTGSDECKADGVYSCCVCLGKDGRKAMAAGGAVKNCKGCKAICEDAKSNGVGEGGAVSWTDVSFTQGACAESKDSFAGPADASAYKAGTRVRGEDVNVLCWTEKECADAKGKWRSGDGCKPKGKDAQGKCEAPEPDYELQNPVIGATTIKGLRSYIGLVFTAAIAFVLIASAIMFTYGAFKYMVSAISSQIGHAKETMIDALIGMVLALSSYVILANVAPNTLNMNAFKIDMINRLSFYSVVYCPDIKPGPKEGAITFQDAGEPTAPKTFNITNGYTITAEKTECGREYFVSGGGQDSICAGNTCPDKGAKCLNCASALASGCKTKSPHEFRCTAARLAGNISSPSGFKPQDVYLTWYGISKESFIFYTFDVDSFSFNSDNTASAGGSSASGYVTSYRFPKANPAYITQFFKDKEDAGFKSGGLVVIVAMKDTSIAGPNQYLVYGKGAASDSCGWITAYFGGATNCLSSTAFGDDYPCTFAGLLDATYAKDRPRYDRIVGNALTKDDLTEANIDKYGSCNISLGENGLPKQ